MWIGSTSERLPSGCLPLGQAQAWPWPEPGRPRARAALPSPTPWRAAILPTKGVPISVGCCQQNRPSRLRLQRQEGFARPTPRPQFGSRPARCKWRTRHPARHPSPVPQSRDVDFGRLHSGRPSILKGLPLPTILAPCRNRWPRLFSTPSFLLRTAGRSCATRLCARKCIATWAASSVVWIANPL